MTTVVLVRHGLTAMTGPVLAGRTPGLHLDERGKGQASRLAARFAGIRLDAIVTSPLDRCLETAGALVPGREATPFHVDERLIECGYGDWTGEELKKLAKDPLWKVVQSHPSAVTFPGPDGEALRDVAVRAVDAVRDWNAQLGPKAVWVACSHGDVIKAIVADALGMHLDSFQRIVVDPCSVTVINYTDLRPFVAKTNDTGGDLAALLAPAKVAKSRRGKATADAAVGGGAGADA